MKKVIVEHFGQPEVLGLRDLPTPQPGPDQVVVRLTSVGMNHADLMARRGEYIISSGHPPFTPGIEGGGVIEAVGPSVKNRTVGQRVILGADAPRPNNNPAEDFLYGGTYTTHYLVPAEQTVPAPDAISDDLLGTLWLPYLTAYGCLVWKQKIKPGQFVAVPAASSSVGLAAAQIIKKQGAIAIGMTTSHHKAEELAKLPENKFDHIVVTHDGIDKMLSWHRNLLKITGRHGVDVFFDPVAAGKYLETEIRALALNGTVWIYGLLGQPSQVDVTPLIRKSAAIRGWYLHELTQADPADLEEGYRYILDGFEKGEFRQRVARTFSLDQVAQAHEEMQAGKHIGKFILLPN